MVFVAGGLEVVELLSWPGPDPGGTASLLSLTALQSTTPSPDSRGGGKPPLEAVFRLLQGIKCECRGCRGDRREGESGEQMVGVGRVPGPSVLGEADPRQLREQQVSLLCRAGQL